MPARRLDVYIGLLIPLLVPELGRFVAGEWAPRSPSGQGSAHTLLTEVEGRVCCVVSSPEIGSWYGNAHALEAPFAEGSDKPLCSQRDALDRRRGPIWLPTLAQTLCFLPYVAARVPITVTLPGTEGTPPQTHVRSRDSNPATPPMGCEEDNWLCCILSSPNTTDDTSKPLDHSTLLARVCPRQRGTQGQK